MSPHFTIIMDALVGEVWVKDLRQISFDREWNEYPAPDAFLEDCRALAARAGVQPDKADFTLYVLIDVEGVKLTLNRKVTGVALFDSGRLMASAICSEVRKEIEHGEWQLRKVQSPGPSLP